MANDLNFDATDVPPTSPITPVPAGKYRAHATETEIKPTKTGRGRYLQITWEILDGEYKGRKVWDRLNIVNENATAQEIAQRALSAICHATGVLKVTDSSQLRFKPVILKLAIEQKGEYDPKNIVKAYEKVEGVSSTPAPAATTAANVPAWAAKRSA